MTNLPDIGVTRKIQSSEYRLYAPQGHFLRAPVVKFFGRLDLDQISLFLDRHYIEDPLLDGINVLPQNLADRLVQTALEMKRNVEKVSSEGN